MNRVTGMTWATGMTTVDYWDDQDDWVTRRTRVIGMTDMTQGIEMTRMDY